MCLLVMFVSFLLFKKETEREHEIEAEVQARQAQLR